MEAIIKKLKLEQINDNYRIKIELLGSDKQNYIIDNTLINDDINFRKQLFGIMCACNCFDLIRLATNNPVIKKVVGYYKNGLQILENKKGLWLFFDKETLEYNCIKADKKQKKSINLLTKNNISDITKEEGSIEKIISHSNVFQLQFHSSQGTTFYTTNQIYYGFGYPLDNYEERGRRDIEKSAKMFTSFIVSLMKFYNIDDLLDFGINKESLPQVEITFNNNMIETITNPITGLGLSIKNEYSIINVFELNKNKKSFLKK